MRPVTVSVGPVGTTSANNIAASQTPAGAGSAIATSITAGSPVITATNTFVAGQAVNFSGGGGFQSVTGANIGETYYVSSTGLTGAHFRVYYDASEASTIVFGGTGTATPNVQTTNQITLNGSLATTVNGYTSVTLPSPQRVLFTTADTTHTFTIYGLDSKGNQISETVGPASAGTAQSALDYAVITNITVSGLLTAAVTVGTNGVASTPWVRLDEWANSQVSIQCDVTGTVNYTVQSTMDDPNSNFGTPLAPSALNWIATNDTNAVAASASVQTNYLFAPTFARVLLNSGPGSVQATFAQANVANQ